MGSPSSVVLVSCGRRKRADLVPAKDLYTSPRFQEARKFAESFADHWFVISAKYGLVSPETAISPYDVALETFSLRQKTSWVDGIVESLTKANLLNSRITVLASGSYASTLREKLENFGVDAAFPFLESEGEAEYEILLRLNSKPKRFLDYKRFYEILSRLNSMPAQNIPFGSVSGKSVHKAGVYFFFDREELTRFCCPDVNRVIRIGTHAVSKDSKSQLWQRLRTHRGNDDLSGSHRSSIFRLHVGSALLCMLGEKLSSWGVGDNASQDVRTAERALEQKVSEYMRQLKVSYLPILDRASADSDRSYIEMNSIALLTGGGAIDWQSTGWLGNSSPTRQIFQSGLWNINYVGSDYDPRFIDVFDELVSNYERGQLSEKSVAPQNWRLHMQRGIIGQQQLF